MTQPPETAPSTVLRRPDPAGAPPAPAAASAAAVNGSLGFDPYRAWLGVRETHRPLTAYQLLGLNALEEDAQAIRAAAGAQRMALQGHRFEAPPEVWNQVHGELEEAIAILLDPDRKTAYDVTLRLQESPEAAPQGSSVAITGRDAAGVRCGHCGFMSSAMRKFCANCGQNLWEPCYKCGTLSMSGEKFCGACGANLGAVVREELERIEAGVREAQRLAAESRFDEATDLLGPLAAIRHVRLAQAAARAQALLNELTAARDRAKESAETALREAKRRASEFDDEAAVRTLEAVPPPLRTADAEHVLSSSLARVRKVADLEAGIRRLVSEGRTDGLLSKVGELLALRPGHATAQELAERFRGGRYRAALKKLEEHDYGAALRLVEQLPRSAWTAEIEALHAKLVELVCMTAALRAAPVVDKPLLSIAARLAKTVPTDPRAARLGAELRVRAERAAASGCLRPAPWAKAPETTRLGLPVDWLTDFRRIAVRDEAHPRLREHPGSFYVACGLALQGLGLGPVRTNLVVKEDRGLRDWVTQLATTPVLWKRPVESAWGLDLGPSGLKAVKLTAEGPDRAAVLAACDLVEHRKPLGQAVNDEERKTLVAETLQTFVSRNDVKAERVCAGLAGRMVLFRELKVPRGDPKKLAPLVEYEARRHMPVSLDDLSWGFEVLGKPAEETPTSREVSVAVVAARRFLLKDHVARFLQAKIAVDVVQCDCLALHNYLVYDRLGPEAGGNGSAAKALPVALVDVGCEATNVIVSAPHSLWFRASGFGGQDFTKALVQQFRLTAVQAEALKRDPAAAESVHECFRAFEPLYEEFERQVRAALDAYHEACARRPVARVLCAGGGFQMHGLMRALWWGR